MTPSEHRISPLAQAYSAARPVSVPASHPGEGTRRRMPAAAQEDAEIGRGPREPIPFGPVPTAVVPGEEVGPIIGAARPAPQRAADRSVEAPSPAVTPPRAPRRYEARADGTARRPMPSIYGHHRLLGYWYVPVAVLLAIAIAAGVIWTVEQFTGEESSSPAVAVSTQPAGSSPAATQATRADAQGTPAATTPSPTASASSTPSGAAGKFVPGDVVTIKGAAPDCLNVRVAPGRTNDAIVCLNDGEHLTITGGPEVSGDLRWWKVKAGQGEGWAAEDYLTK